jgi:DNA polymerase-3 subunit delta'
MQFATVIGQQAVKADLHQMVTADRLPHALLFLGPGGSGKLALALALAQYVLCEKPLEGEACGECPQCSKVEKLIHPDLHFSFPTIGTNVTSDSFLPQWREALLENPYMDVNEWLQRIGAENKQGNINKQECVNIIHKLSLKTFSTTRKVLIMWLPEYLGKEGNRLLKLIEEPPENTLFILVAENQELILNTILSRCQIVKVNGLADETITEALKTLGNVDEATATTAAQLSDGNYNEALKFARSKENDHARLFLDWLRMCYQGNGVKLVQWAEKIATLGRENQKQFIQYALHFMREYLVLKMTGEDKVRLQAGELETARKLMSVIAFDQIEQIVNLLSEHTYFVERNANPKVLFLSASIEMNRILKRRT